MENKIPILTIPSFGLIARKSGNLLGFLIFFGLLLSCTEKPAPGKQGLITEGFSNQVLDAYCLYLPKAYDEQKKWPLIIYLQGCNASTSPNPNTVKDGGPVYFLTKQQESLPDSFVMVNPHMRTGPMEQRQWFDQAEGLIQIINQTIRNHQVDPNRIYLTGVSRGGHGTWGVAKKYPEKFAAIVPIAGALSCKSNCEGMADLPMWIFHNDGSPLVDYEYPQTAVKYLEPELERPFIKTSNVDLDQSMISSNSIFTTLASDEHVSAAEQVY